MAHAPPTAISTNPSGEYKFAKAPPIIRAGTNLRLKNGITESASATRN